MIATATALDTLKRQRPEWVPWLAVVEEIVREAATRRWDTAVPAQVEAEHTPAPLLAGAPLVVEAGAVDRLLARLVRLASAGGTPKMATLDAALRAKLDMLALFRASMCMDAERINQMAVGCGADAEALQAVAALVPVPFLHACNRRWSHAIHESWMEGYCPVCASWPVFAEVRGIERSRYFRCGRCGGEWHARTLVCPYCAMDDHNDLTALVPARSDTHAVVEACRRCHGYVKVFTRLQGCHPGVVMLEDLASVDLDVAALEQGYMRPTGLGWPLDITVSDTGAKRRLFRWNA